jgi:voltage-gated potassium channel Kch
MTTPHDREPHHVAARITAAQRLATAFHKRMMSVMLVLLLVLVFIVPAVAQNEHHARLLIDVLLTCVLAAGTLSALENRPLLFVLGGCSLFAMGLRWSEWVVPLGFLPIVRDLSMMLTLLVMAVAVGKNVFGSSADIEDRVVGAVVLYLLIGMLNAVAYYAIAIADPTAFNQGPIEPFALTKWIYFSFVTLTTVGYGDITPVTRLPRSIATLEALVGQLYPAVILARLVALPRA